MRQPLLFLLSVRMSAVVCPSYHVVAAALRTVMATALVTIIIGCMGIAAPGSRLVVHRAIVAARCPFAGCPAAGSLVGMLLILGK